MKKFLCCMVLMMAAMTISAMTQTKASSPPEYDIGYCQTVATLSVDGMPVVAFNQDWIIVDLQTPVMLGSEASAMSAQVVDAYTAATPHGLVSMTLVSYRWPRQEQSIINEDPINSTLSPGESTIHSFTTQRADFS